MQKEMWRPIPDYEGYDVSNLGRVRSYRNPGRKGEIAADPQRILRASSSANSRYRKVRLMQNHVPCTRKVADLVLETFVGPRPKGMDVCHNDCNPANDELDNLRYDTRAANLHDGCGEFVKGRLTNTEALRMRLEASQGVTDEDLARRFKVGVGIIECCRRGETYQYVGGPITNRRIALTDTEVVEMRQSANNQYLPLTVLATRFGVTESLVSLILRGLRRAKAGGPIMPSRMNR